MAIWLRTKPSPKLRSPHLCAAEEEALVAGEPIEDEWGRCMKRRVICVECDQHASDVVERFVDDEIALHMEPGQRFDFERCRGVVVKVRSGSADPAKLRDVHDAEVRELMPQSGKRLMKRNTAGKSFFPSVLKFNFERPLSRARGSSTTVRTEALWMPWPASRDRPRLC